MVPPKLNENDGGRDREGERARGGWGGVEGGWGQERRKEKLRVRFRLRKRERGVRKGARRIYVYAAAATDRVSQSFGYKLN